MAQNLLDAFDALLGTYGGDAFAAETARARGEYEGLTGRVFSDDELYEARTFSFLEWYLVERPLAGGKPPIAKAMAEGGHVPELFAWATSHRSLFLVAQLWEGKVTLEDLLGGGVFEVHERRRMAGVASGDIVEARLIGYDGSVLFGRTFLYHPARAKAAIFAHARRIRGEGGSRVDVVHHVAALRIRAERYKHIAPEKVYDPRATVLSQDIR